MDLYAFPARKFCYLNYFLLGKNSPIECIFQCYDTRWRAVRIGQRVGP